MQIDINKIVTDELKKIDFESIIRKKVTESMTSVVEKEIGDLFGHWGVLSKGLEEALKQNLNVDFTKIKLDEYHEFILNGVQQELSRYFNNPERFNIREIVDERLLTETREEIPYKDMVAQIEKMVMEEFSVEEHHTAEWSDTAIEIDVEDDNSTLLSGTKYKKVLVKWDMDESLSALEARNKASFTFHLSGGKVYHWAGQINCLKQWARALKFKQTVITGL